MDGYIVYVLRGVMPQRSFECNDIVLFEYFAKKIVRPYVTFLAPVSHSGEVHYTAYACAVLI